MSVGLRLLPLALGIAAAACHDATSPGDRSGLTPGGVIVSASLSRSSIALGDTAWFVVTLRNPRDTTVVVHFQSPCEVDFVMLDSTGQAPFPGFTSCDLYRPTDLAIPGDSSLTYRYGIVKRYRIGNGPDYFEIPRGTYRLWGVLGPLVGTSAQVWSNVRWLNVL